MKNSDNCKLIEAVANKIKAFYAKAIYAKAIIADWSDPLNIVAINLEGLIMEAFKEYEKD